MKLYVRGNGVELVVSRRNLEVLLAKLDREGSARTIIGTDAFLDGVPADGVFILRAEENDQHYSDRPAGAMLEDLL